MENNMNSYIDLHMHSTYSDDGEFSPAELVKMCHDAEIRIISITDHNCVKANIEAEKEAEHLNIHYISGIEIDCVYQDINMHLIGYNINCKSKDFEDIENNIRKQAKENSYKSLELTRQLGFVITEDELNALCKNAYWKGTWTGDMFADILLAKPEYSDNEILLPYRKGGSKGDNPYVNFYWDYYSQGKPCYTNWVFPSLKDAISLIKDNGGKTVLAHPGIYLKNQSNLLSEIKKLGLDGLEVFSSYHDKQDAEHFYKEAKRNNLFVTCGSDFHGKLKPPVKLGKSGCFIDPSEIENAILNN